MMPRVIVVPFSRFPLQDDAGKMPALHGVAVFLGFEHFFGGGGFSGFDHFGEAVEEVGGVVRAGGGFGMVLDGEDGFGGVAETFEGLVVEVDVGGFSAAGFEGGEVDGEAVVLGGDFDFFGADVLDGLVAAAVTEFEFVGCGAHGEAEELVAEADAEDGFLADEFFQGVLDVGDGFGVAGAVGDEDAVGFEVEDFFGGGEGGDDGDAEAGLDEVAEDVAFESAVDCHYVA